MKKVFLLLFVLSSLTQAIGQYEFGKNFVGAKLLFLEYGRANGIDTLNITNGIEAFYQRNFNKYLSIAIPGKAGAINVMGDRNNRRFLSLDGLLHVHWYEPEARFFPYLLGGVGMVWEEFEEANTQVPLGGGINIRVGKSSYVNLQGEYRISMSEDRDNLQAGLGFVYRLDKVEPDTDGDGVRDSQDACPQTPGKEELAGCPDRDNDGVVDQSDECPDIAGAANLNGCPDSDGDGIPNKDDQCPGIAGTAELFGCPDRDGDGVADRYDNCPDEAGLKANNGCPVSDRDDDGIPDDMDNCPDEAGPKATAGCPDQDEDGFPDSEDRCPEIAGAVAGCPDTDQDGLIDPDDKCPEEAGPAANEGCPEIEEEVKEVLDLATRAVQFETGKANLKAESFNVLDQIADIMRQYPNYNLRISGHTDSVGNDENNRILSEERAKACYQYLISKGIVPERISFYGYGEERPIATNDTPQGRSLNRRVEFELYRE